LIGGLLLGPGALGVYVIALSFTNLPRLVGQSVGLVAFPRIARLDTADSRRSLLFFPAAVALITGLLAIALALTAGSLVPLLFGQEFVESVPVVRVLLLYSVLSSVRRVLTDSLRGMDAAGLGTTAEMLSWPVLAAGLFLLPHPLGAVGLAWALVAYASTGLLMAIAVTFSRALRPLTSARKDTEGTGAFAVYRT
jgi:O-antigen/teichoic acid export membrane protein